MAVKNVTKPISRLLFEGEKVRVGHFHLPAEHPEFPHAGPITLPTLVFPRTATYIQQHKRARFLAEPTSVNIYDGTRSYHREVFDERGDICDWFEIDPHWFAQTLSQINDRVEVTEVSFATDHVHCHPHTYANQRRLVSQLLTSECEVFQIEEAVLLLIGEVISNSYNLYENFDKSAINKSNYRDLCHAVKQLLVKRFSDNFSLDALAQELSVSTFHMCRVFKKVTGTTIHQYRNQLRLHCALEYLQEQSDIAKIAVDLGYASHSHFSTAFLKMFGYSPKQFKRSNKINKAAYLAN